MPSQYVEIKGHIIDSLILPKILDQVMDASGSFMIEKIYIGQRKRDTSFARVKISSATKTSLNAIIQRISKIGATPVVPKQVKLVSAPRKGVFPPDFYCTTNLKTLVYHQGRWREVSRIEMDCGVVIRAGQARCVSFSVLQRGEKVVCGTKGIQVIPLERSTVVCRSGPEMSTQNPRSGNPFIRLISSATAPTPSATGRRRTAPARR